jgi:hypothetical protein
VTTHRLGEDTTTANVAAGSLPSPIGRLDLTRLSDPEYWEEFLKWGKSAGMDEERLRGIWATVTGDD